MKSQNFSRSVKISIQVALFLALILLNFGPGGSKTAYAALTNDNWASATTILGVPYSESFDVSAATGESGEIAPTTTCDGNTLLMGTNTVWYKFTSGFDRSVSFDTVGSDYDTYIAVWTGNALNALTLVGCDDDNDLGFTSQLYVKLTAGVPYYIQVARYNGNTSTNKPNPTPCPCNMIFNVKSQTFEDVPPITDVPTNYWAAAWIKELAAEGITGGCGNGKYCPSYPVTRDQMAVFLLRSEHGSSYNPPPVGSTTGFTDVPTNYWVAAWIKQLAAEGITGGCGNGNYCPSYSVTRDQMAVFLDKTFSIPVP